MNTDEERRREYTSGVFAFIRVYPCSSVDFVLQSHELPFH